MNVEKLNFSQAEMINAEEFNLDSFFETEKNAVEHEKEEPKTMPDLLVTLRDDADESIGTLKMQVTSESFARGASFTSNVFAGLGSLVGSCGVFCAHSLEALSKAGSGFPGVSGLSGSSNMPGLNLDKNGNFHLDGNINTLSRATGISQGDLLSGKFSAEDILSRFFSTFGESLSLIFGFGIAGTLLNCFFDSFLPQSTSGEMPLAA